MEEVSKKQKRLLLKKSPEIIFPIVWGLKLDQPPCCLDFHVKCLILGLDILEEKGSEGEQYTNCPKCTKKIQKAEAAPLMEV